MSEEIKLVTGANGYAVTLPDGGFLKEDGTYGSPANAAGECSISCKDKPAEYRASMEKLGALYVKKRKLESELEAVSKELDKQLVSTPAERMTGSELGTYGRMGMTKVVRAKAIALVTKNKLRPLYYIYGYKYRGAEERKIDKEKMLAILKKASCIELYAYKDRIVLQQYSASDLW